MTTDTRENHVGTTAGRTWLRQARAFTERYLRVLLRNRAVLFWGIGFPAGFYVLTLFLFVDVSEVPAGYRGDTKAIIAVGYGVFGGLIVCLNAFAQHLIEDFEVKRYEQFRSLPVSPTADVAGRMFAGYLFMLLAVLAVLLVGIVAGAEYTLRSLASIPVVLGVLAGFAVLWMVIAAGVAVLVRDSRYGSIIAVSIALVSYFVTGFNGTTVDMFAGNADLLNLLPNTLATRVMAYHLVGVEDWATAGMAPPGPPTGAEPILLLGAYGAVCLAAGYALMTRVVYHREVVA